jgi:uncharacterized RDD family membrane protein YckC
MPRLDCCTSCSSRAQYGVLFSTQRMVIMSSGLLGDRNASVSFVDQLTIETPEQTALDFHVAGIGSRFIALALDTLVQTAVGLIVLIAGGFGIAGLSKYWPRSSMWGAALMILFYFLLYFGYFALFEVLWNGQTPGKRWTKIRVIKDSGRPLTPAESIGRNLMRIVDWMPTLYAVGILSAILTRENKRLGDLLVGSLVVRESSLAEIRPGWGTQADASFSNHAPLGSALLSAGDFALIDSFLNRRFDLEPTVRFRMADVILRRLKPQLTLPAENSLSSEKVLEALAYERRATSRYA